VLHGGRNSTCKNLPIIVAAMCTPHRSASIRHPASRRAPAGTLATLSFSPRYAAPEVVAAYEAKELRVLADPSADVWSLGIIAYELLTDTPVFGRGATAASVFDQITGRAELPWESVEQKDAGFRKLRMLKRSVLKCLAREPAERPSAGELLGMWERLFDSFGADATYVPVSQDGTDSVV
jgi:serine/threonine protein kinase